MSFLLTQYGVEVEVDTTPFGTARTWAPINQGFNNLAEELGEQLQEYFFLGDNGYGSEFVTGLHPKYTITGVRVVGDTAQDFIFGQRMSLMAGRNTYLRISLVNADGTVSRFTNFATMTGVSGFGGATTDGAAVSVAFMFNGRPVTETVAATGTLTVTSVAGATTGTTVIKAVPTFPDAGCKFVYAYGATAPTATPGSVLTGWNDFVNGATYTIASGKLVTVAMVNVSTFIVVASGGATIVAKA